MQTKRLLIAVDGTAGSGKGTISRALAAHYTVPYLDTGKLYRYVASQALAKNIAVSDEKKLCDLATNIEVEALKDPFLAKSEIGEAASKIASLASLRQALLQAQRRFAQRDLRGALLDGRDIGTIILPDANVKLFIDASVETRAQRRHDQLLAEFGKAPDVKMLKQDLELRDKRDRDRETAPLRRAKDAQLIDTTALTIEQAVTRATMIVDAYLASRHKSNGS